MGVRHLLVAPLLLGGLVSLFIVGASGPVGPTTGVRADGAIAAVGQEPDVTTAKSRASLTRVAESRGDLVESSLAAGPSAFVPIPAYRMYDSRQDPTGKWTNGENFLLGALTDVFGVPKVPETATAVTFNVTVTETEGGGFVQIYGPGVAPLSTSTVNWVAAGVDIANSGSSQLGELEGDPGWMGVALGANPDSAAHIIIDITGYYEELPA